MLPLNTSENGCGLLMDAYYCMWMVEMPDDIFTKLDKAETQFSLGDHAAWMMCIKKLRAAGHTVEVSNHTMWVINKCIMWAPLDDTKEL